MRLDASTTSGRITSYNVCYTKLLRGAVPLDVDSDIDVDPYGTRSPYYCVDDKFYDLWVASLAHCMRRYEGKRRYASKKPSGGVGAFSADNRNNFV